MTFKIQLESCARVADVFKRSISKNSRTRHTSGVRNKNNSMFKIKIRRNAQFLKKSPQLPTRDQSFHRSLGNYQYREFSMKDETDFFPEGTKDFFPSKNWSINSIIYKKLWSGFVNHFWERKTRTLDSVNLPNITSKSVPSSDL